MVPHGIYVLAAERSGKIAAATMNWVTQTAFAPPLVAVGVKTDSGAYDIAKETGGFALTMLGKGQQGLAFEIFKSVTVEGDKVSGEPFHAGSTGAPILDNAIASVECQIVEIVEQGDHHIFVGEVVDANITKQPEGRADEAILEMKELGGNAFYGG